jgi:hypothetical protein
MPGWNIAEVKKGERPTLLEADKANEIIKALNALGNMTVKRTDRNFTNRVVYLDDEVMIGVSSVPPGYDEKEIEICEDGEIKTYVILVKGPID